MDPLFIFKRRKPISMLDVANRYAKPKRMAECSPIALAMSYMTPPAESMVLTIAATPMIILIALKPMVMGLS